MVVFTRDTGSGRVSIDREGRPVISYWPCPTTRKHLMEVGEGVFCGWSCLADASLQADHMSLTAFELCCACCRSINTPPP